jgi:hypothetical protein
MAYNKETEMYEGYIYKIENLINHKLYIGKTTRSIHKRWIEHQYRSKDLKSYIAKEGKKTLYYAINKYGIENFSISELNYVEHPSKEDLDVLLDDLEEKLIEKYNSIVPYGYNISHGGKRDGSRGKQKAVAQYDLNGCLLKTYSSASDAEEINGIYGVSDACLGRHPIIGGFMWRYIENNNIVDKIIPYEGGLRTKRIIQVDFDGNIIKEYLSINEASKETGINNVTIGDCVNNRNCRLTAGGYSWYEIGFDIDIVSLKYDKYVKPEHLNYGTGKETVNMYTLQDEYVMTFDSVKEASMYINKHPSNITKCINKCQKSSGGYKWYHANDPTQPDKSKIQQTN